MTLDEVDQKRYNALGCKTTAATEEDIVIAKMKAKKNGKKEPDIKVGDITFRRYERHPVLGNLGSPAVLGVDEGTAIGNDSVATVAVEVYPYTFEGTAGFATRMVSLTVDNLVPYVKPETNEAPV
jgi:hypothetical protein